MISLGNGIGRGSDVHPTHGFIGDGADDQATHVVLMNPADALPSMPHTTTKAKAREAFQRRKRAAILPITKLVRVITCRMPAGTESA